MGSERGPAGVLADQMLKLETPWDDDEDEDVPHRPEEDDEEPLRA
jgi:hypothetical protein